MTSPSETSGISSRPTSLGREELLLQIRDVIELEGKALLDAAKHVGPSCYDAMSLIARSSGKVILTGVGKSGIIARKIAATLSSTGTPATFLHPSDGMHGDLGIVSANDVIVALGKSGETE